MNELTGEDKQMLLEILRKAGIPVIMSHCEAIRCCANEDGYCISEVVIEVDDEGICQSYRPNC